MGTSAKRQGVFYTVISLRHYARFPPVGDISLLTPDTSQSTQSLPSLVMMTVGADNDVHVWQESVCQALG